MTKTKRQAAGNAKSAGFLFEVLDWELDFMAFFVGDHPLLTKHGGRAGDRTVIRTLKLTGFQLAPRSVNADRFELTLRPSLVLNLDSREPSSMKNLGSVHYNRRSHVTSGDLLVPADAFSAITTALASKALRFVLASCDDWTGINGSVNNFSFSKSFDAESYPDAAKHEGARRRS